jgi:putative ABC transport system permease protein
MNNVVVQASASSAEGRLASRSRSSGLTKGDAEAAKDLISDASSVAVIKSYRAWNVWVPLHPVEAAMHGVSLEYFHAVGLQIESGRAFVEFDEQKSSRVAVLGAEVARRMFPSESSLGHKLKVNDEWLTVIGTLSHREVKRREMQGVALLDDSNSIFVPYATANLLFEHDPLDDPVDRIVLTLRSIDHVEYVARRINSLLSSRHGGESDFSIVIPQHLYEQSQKTQRLFNGVLLSVASISLIVGGIGIMNIFLANALERRREIGLLRALGATRAMISMQLMRETAVLCLGGTIIGLALGIASAYTVGAIVGWNVAWSAPLVLLDCLFCWLVAVCFGIYPARRAAAMDPISAIRGE